MKDVKERIARVEEQASSAHKRIDEGYREIESLRDSRHEHSNQIHQQMGIITTHTTILTGMESAVKELTQAVFSFKIMALTALYMGGAFIAFCGFVGGKLLHWF